MLPWQGLKVTPLMAVGVAGTAVLTTTARVSPGLLPQVLWAITITFPLLAPAVVAKVVDVEVPDHPPGHDQL